MEIMNKVTIWKVEEGVKELFYEGDTYVSTDKELFDLLNTVVNNEYNTDVKQREDDNSFYVEQWDDVEGYICTDFILDITRFDIDKYKSDMKNKNLDLETSHFKKVDKVKCDKLVTPEIREIFNDLDFYRKKLGKIVTDHVGIGGFILPEFREEADRLDYRINTLLASLTRECESVGLAYRMANAYLYGYDDYWIGVDVDIEEI